MTSLKDFYCTFTWKISSFISGIFDVKIHTQFVRPDKEQLHNVTLGTQQELNLQLNCLFIVAQLVEC